VSNQEFWARCSGCGVVYRAEKAAPDAGMKNVTEKTPSYGVACQKCHGREYEIAERVRRQPD